MRKTVRKTGGKKTPGKPGINRTVYKHLFDDIKDSAEFKKGYQEELLSEFAYKIKEERIKMGLTQKDIAREVGTKQQVISRFEKGVDDIKLSTFLKVINTIHIDLVQLLNSAKRDKIKRQSKTSNIY